MVLRVEQGICSQGSTVACRADERLGRTRSRYRRVAEKKEATAAFRVGSAGAPAQLRDRKNEETFMMMNKGVVLHCLLAGSTLLAAPAAHAAGPGWASIGAGCVPIGQTAQAS